MKIEPTLSIIIISYNTKGLLKGCLTSIFSNDKFLDFSLAIKKSEKIPTEIIVVDNNSQDESVAYLKKLEKNKKIKLILNKENLGFAKANNQGMKLAKGNYYLLLNSDTLILNCAISQTLLWLASHEEAGAATCQLLNKDKTIQPSGGFFPNLTRVFCWSFFLDDLPLFNKLVKPIHPHADTFYTKDSWYNQIREQDWITGAFFMIKKAAAQDSGYFDENFFMYAEELEWCYRLKQKGWKIYYLNNPAIIHLGGGSAKTPEGAIINEYLGLERFFQLHKPKWQFPLIKLLFKTNALARWLVFGIIGGSQEKKDVYQKALKKI